MKYNYIGDSGLLVSRVALGGVQFGDNGLGAESEYGNLDRAAAKPLVEYALDSGINFFDTSNIYCNGASERIVGELLSAKRHDVVLSTKVGGRAGEAITDAGLSRKHILRACDESLDRLKTDYIDLYIAHFDDPFTPLEETLEAFNDLVRVGKVRYIGFSNWRIWRAVQAVQIQKERGWSKFCCGQMYYSALTRDVEYDFAPFMLENGLALTAWGPLNHGLLSGEYSLETFDKEAIPKDSRANRVDLSVHDPRGVAFKLIKELRNIAEQKQVTVAQIASAWLLSKQVVGSILIGASTINQLKDNIGACDIDMHADELETLDSVTALPKTYPHWFFESFKDSRIIEAIS